MTKQQILHPKGDYREVGLWLERKGICNVMLVCDQSIRFLKINAWFEKLKQSQAVKLTVFSDFQPNPLYESVCEGVRLFHEAKCEAVIAVGGGSALDVAKCIKLFANMEPESDYLAQKIVPNLIPLMAMPTTAGTGSEATRFAVIYRNGEKQSIADDSAIPETVLMDPSALVTLPAYQKKATMLDALCHAIESYWSVNATRESVIYSKDAIVQVLRHMDGYFAGTLEGCEGMLWAAHTAGKAINITQTTAGHAMCYKLTSLYGIAHGHAAALCVSTLWKHMILACEPDMKPNGWMPLGNVFDELAVAMGTGDRLDAAEKFQCIVDSMQFPEIRAREEDYALLKRSVNPVRLKNNPMVLTEETIDRLYHEILKETL